MVTDPTLFDEIPTHELTVVLVAKHILLKALAKRLGIEPISQLPRSTFASTLEPSEVEQLMDEIETLKALVAQ
ncbi:hypothetical protein FRD01_13680 [Microvenator marinus]|uniref:Uncharacterized protein n=1 Tax=Microvenator marinus TaxID=2600177 RepID=A0A5B8XSN2_9DELT|nr:hypothetical protein [Microvenator marinus]QED28261.1 hypothetical protein FRD01_13680 [Microvenator marinus]